MTSAERWDRVKQVFHDALEQPRESREAFVAEACEDDPDLRTQVMELLASDSESEDFLDPPSNIAADAFREAKNDLDSGHRVGAYRLVQKIASGGMGIVYLAERDDRQFRQQVAIKVIKRGMDTEHILRRFRRERQTLAQLAHPYIARLLDGGATEDGQPYLVMEYIEGQPIDVECEERRLDTKARIALFRKVCEAVQYAHANLIVHRDLKPGNILVTPDGTPKLLDFGIAKLLEEDGDEHDLSLTNERDRPMTPRYASPEQVRGEAITVASDVYSLGLVLYELLTGHRPYRIETRDRREVERIVCEESPARPSTVIGRTDTLRTSDGNDHVVTPESVSRTREGRPDRLRRRLAGDLDTILLTALRKEPNRRYGSALALSEDLGNYLTGHPITARPESFTYRASKFVRRNRIAVLAASLVFLSLITGIITTSAESRRARRAERDATERYETSQAVVRFLLDIFETPDPRESSDTTLDAEGILDRGAQRIRSQLTDRPTTRATLMNAIGKAYRAIGEPRKAFDLMTDALELRRAELGDSALETAATRGDLGLVLIDLALYDEAERELLVALEAQVARLDSPHPDLARTETLLGIALRNLGRYEEAEAAYRRSLAMRLSIFGEEHRLTAYTLTNLAGVLANRGNYEESEAMHRRALAIRERVLDADHPDIAESLNGLALALRAQRSNDEAEEFYRRALELNRLKYGDEHPKTARSMANLASVLRDLKKFGEASRLARASLESLEAVYGARHPDVAMASNRIAELFLVQGRYADSLEPLERAIEILRAAYPAGHDHVALTLTHLGLAKRGLRRPAEAVDHYREAATIYETLHGADHPHVKVARQGLESALAEAGE